MTASRPRQDRVLSKFMDFSQDRVKTALRPRQDRVLKFQNFQIRSEGGECMYECPPQCTSTQKSISFPTHYLDFHFQAFPTILRSIVVISFNPPGMIKIFDESIHAAV